MSPSATSPSTSFAGQSVVEPGAPGIDIPASAAVLRNYARVQRARLKILAGWFLRVADYETKYRLADHLYTAVEHVSLLRGRLAEMRGGKPDASVRPDLVRFLDDCLHAPDDDSFLAGFYGVLTRGLAASLRRDLDRLDPCGNANEHRLFRRMTIDLDEEVRWFDRRKAGQGSGDDWSEWLRRLLASIGGIHGDGEPAGAPPPPPPHRFVRPGTIVFDERIRRDELAAYENRQEMAPEEATVEQFRVFFNEFYAAALLASVLFDAAEGDYPWEFFADFGRHFWDEARHSEFGCIRLRELGVEPDRVNPVLFEEAQDLPVLHRVAYLTRGLEAYFMPRKPKRVKEYAANGDPRSQLFADQDWSDEMNHVKYGSRWYKALLEYDHREVEDVLEEVREHLSRKRGEEVRSIDAPF